jgi:hypothetical protein
VVAGFTTAKPVGALASWIAETEDTQEAEQFAGKIHWSSTLFRNAAVSISSLTFLPLGLLDKCRETIQTRPPVRSIGYGAGEIEGNGFICTFGQWQAQPTAVQKEAMECAGLWELIGRHWGR